MKNKTFLIIIILLVLGVGFVSAKKVGILPLGSGGATVKPGTIGVPVPLGTIGSVLFIDGSTNLGQDNANFFWDDVNNILSVDGVYVGTLSPPLDTTDHQVYFLMDGTKDIVIDGTTNNRNVDTGTMRFEQQPDIVNTRALTINVDANGQVNTHAVVVNMTATGIGAGETITNYDVNIDSANSTGGIVRGYEMSITGAGSIVAHLLHADPGVVPLTHFSGTFGNMDECTMTGLGDILASCTDTATDATLFADDNDELVIGDAVRFSQISIDLDTFAGGAGIAPTFEFSTGSDTWTAFTPTDETQGMRQSGVINWALSDISSWATGTSTRYFIRITRTRDNIPTVPIENLIQISVTNVYAWDALGNINMNALNASSTLLVDGLSIFASNLVPKITDGSSLGTTALNFSDLFIDAGGVLNFDSGNMTITHSAGVLNFAGGNIGIASSTPIATLGITGAVVVTPIDLTDGATITINWALGNNFRVTLGGNRAIAHTNQSAGQFITVTYIQDGTGTRLFPTNPAEGYCNGGDPTFRTGPGEVDYVVYNMPTSTATIICTP